MCVTAGDLLFISVLLTVAWTQFPRTATQKLPALRLAWHPCSTLGSARGRKPGAAHVGRVPLTLDGVGGPLGTGFRPLGRDGAAALRGTETDLRPTAEHFLCSEDLPTQLSLTQSDPSPTKASGDAGETVEGCVRAILSSSVDRIELLVRPRPAVGAVGSQTPPCLLCRGHLPPGRHAMGHVCPVIVQPPGLCVPPALTHSPLRPLPSLGSQ